MLVGIGKRKLQISNNAKRRTMWGGDKICAWSVIIGEELLRRWKSWCSISYAWRITSEDDHLSLVKNYWGEEKGGTRSVILSSAKNKRNCDIDGFWSFIFKYAASMWVENFAKKNITILLDNGIIWTCMWIIDGIIVSKLVLLTVVVYLKHFVLK